MQLCGQGRGASLLLTRSSLPQVLRLLLCLLRWRESATRVRSSGAIVDP